jgi:ligand-binding sensor domain-containing protein/signal transduction histidine kinase
VNGLASDEITDLRVDERGYLWVGTVDGLSRFDGERFVTFGPESGLPSARILAIEVLKGRLFVATAKGLTWLDEARSGRRPFVLLEAPDGMEGQFGVLYGDREGRLWAGGEGGLAVFEGTGSGRGRKVDLPTGEKTAVRSIAQDDTGTTWVGTSRGLVRLAPGHPAEWRHVEELDGRDGINALAVDDGRRLWIGHEMRLYVLSLPGPGERLEEGPLGGRALPGLGPGGRVVLPSAPGEVRRFTLTGRPLRDVRSAAGRTLVATNEALTEFGAGAANVVISVRSVLNDSVSSIDTDRDGNTWIGSEGHGLLRLRRDGVAKFGPEDGLPDQRIRSVFAPPGGPLVVLGSRPGILSAGRQGSFTKVHLKLPPAGYQGWGWGQIVLRDRSGDWWLATGTGLCRFGPAPSPEGLDGKAPKRVYTMGGGPGGDDIFRIFEDGAGDLWIGSFGQNFLTRWDRRTGTLEPIHDPALPKNTPTAFAEDRAGNLWTALYGHAVARLRRGKWDGFPSGGGRPEGFVQAFLAARDGVLWIGTGRDGLWRVDDPDADRPVFTRHAGGEPLPSQNIRALAEDDSGHVWIGSTRGVARLDPTSGRVRLFGPLQGLPNEVVTSAARDKEGKVWFGTLDGLVRITPGVDSVPRVPVALLTAVAVDGAPRFLSPLGKAELPDQELPAEWRRISVEFVAPSLSPEASPRFETRLAGAETAFGPPSDVRRADFTGLAPGRYRFEVRAVRGQAAGPAASFGFVVPVPFWRQPWVAGCVVLVAASVVYSAHRVRVAHLLALERVRTGIATDLHDDLGSSLSRISLLAEVVRREAEGRPQAQRLAADIGEAARKMGGALSDNIWSVDPRHDDLQSVADRISVFAADLFETRDVGWRMVLPAEIALQAVPPRVRRHLLLGLKEAVNNAAKHAAARNVEVGFRMDGRSLRVTVADDGRGLGSGSFLAPGSGRGLAGMRRRAEEMGGTFEIVSAPGEGTKAAFSVPLPRTA